MTSEQYKVEVEPSTRFGWVREKPCLKVTVTTSPPWAIVGIKRTSRADQDEARALAAHMIAEWEREHSEVVL